MVLILLVLSTVWFTSSESTVFRRVRDSVGKA